jgi:hypothetical protein
MEIGYRDCHNDTAFSVLWQSCRAASFVGQIALGTSNGAQNVAAACKGLQASVYCRRVVRGVVELPCELSLYMDIRRVCAGIFAGSVGIYSYALRQPLPSISSSTQSLHSNGTASEILGFAPESRIEQETFIMRHTSNSLCSFSSCGHQMCSGARVSQMTPVQVSRAVYFRSSSILSRCH